MAFRRDASPKAFRSNMPPKAFRTNTPRLIGPLLAGLSFSAACPPYDLWPLAWLVPALVLLPLRNASKGVAYIGGTLYAVVIGTLITSWAPHAASAYFEHDPWTSRFFILAVHVTNPGIPCGLMALAYASFAGRADRLRRPLLGAFLWVACEWVRTWSLGWELLAHSQHENLALIQISDVLGAYGVSFVMVAVSLAVGEWLIEFARRRSVQTDWRPIAVPAFLLVGVLAYGFVRLAAPVSDESDLVSVAVVQGDVPNQFRWQRQHFGRAVATYARLTDELIGDSTPDLIIWPENAVSFYLNREGMMRSQIGRLASRAKHGIVLGAPRRGAGTDAFNSAYHLEPNGSVGGVYDKRYLLPFGEFDPFLALRGEAPEGPTYVGGDRPTILQAGPYALGPMICFEVLYPDLARDLVRQGAEILVNLSNDSWMDPGDGNAPRQHFSMAVFRAIEARRYLVRASASGVSGIVDPTGRVIDRVTSGKSGGVVAGVRPQSEITPYVALGDMWIAAGILWTLSLVVVWRPSPRVAPFEVVATDG